MAAFALLAFGACKDDGNGNGGGAPAQSTGAEVDASDKSWHYYSLERNTEVGTGEESAGVNAQWFARTDWDVALSGYKVRTNSGEATTAGSQGGVYTFSERCDRNGADAGAQAFYETVTAVPPGAEFVADKTYTDAGMSGTDVLVRSEASVIRFLLKEDGSKVMPPCYMQSPVYIFRSADGQKHYKLVFTQYKDADGVSGKVRFHFARV